MYYTFSTIAQVLAAFISLSGVFVIFKLQEIRKMLLQHTHNFINQVDRIQTLGKSDLYNCKGISINLVNLHRGECIIGIIEEMKNHFANRAVQGDEIRFDLGRIMNAFISLNRKRILIRLLALIAIISGVITILYSIIILHVIPYSGSIGSRYFNWGFAGTSLSILIMTTSIVIALIEFKMNKTK